MLPSLRRLLKAVFVDIMQGFIPTAIYKGHHIGIYFLKFEYLVQRIVTKKDIERKEMPVLRLCVGGAASGYTMWLSVYPFDSSHLESKQKNLPPKYRGMTDLFTKGKGIKGFVEGSPNNLKRRPVNAATFYLFKLTMRTLG
jgi:solute carrier family 25 carnitine/acylcarnitine transporter 20/29